MTKIDGLKKLVYLANRYSSDSPDPDIAALERHHRRAVESYVGGTLRKKYRDVCFILPIALSASMADLCTFGTGFDEWAGDDYTFIANCAEVWVLTAHEWRKSVGVKKEIEFANTNNIPVKYIHSITLELTDSPQE